MKIASSLFVTLLIGCLPDDTRDPPARVEVTLAPMEIGSGIHTDDDWDISFRRFLISFGRVHTILDGCTEYSENDYGRILDMLRPEPQHVATLFAVGTCPIGMAIIPPQEGHSVNGAGVDEETERFLMDRAGNLFGPEDAIAVQVDGTASKLDRAVSFRWSFRRFAPFLTCDSLVLGSEDMLAINVSAVGSVLFRTRLETPNAEVRFDELAAADADGDGDLTLLELEAIPTGEPGPHATLAQRMHGLLRELLISADVKLCTPNIKEPMRG